MLSSKHTARLEALLFEAKGEWAEAERAYALILEGNPFDQVLLYLISLFQCFSIFHIKELNVRLLHSSI
jgi:hypothetical protein